MVPALAIVLCSLGGVLLGFALGFAVGKYVRFMRAFREHEDRIEQHSAELHARKGGCRQRINKET